MKVLVTGGLGFIGSHTVIKLIEAGHQVVIIDNLFNSKPDVVDRIDKIVGVKPKVFIQDVCDKDKLMEIFKAEKPDAVIHFAGYKAVGESCQKPLMYYRNNIDSALSVLECMMENECKNLVFSSSATIYGETDKMPITELSPRKEATNPYGQTKVMIERIIEDVCKVNPDFNAALLRYFNPIGAHPSGLLGEDPNGLPNNLLPYINKVATGELDHLNVFGNDYPTVDGTGVRDYIHVLDLAKGHVLALKKLENGCGLFVCNLGTGKGTSVLEMVSAYEKATGVKIKYEIKPRRAGDVAESYAATNKAKEELGFECDYTILDACKHGYEFQKANKVELKCTKNN
ncbi:MAG: UDP-glucose 4-epimerase GalE [Clostridia bacterium]|nr:UDP-glucose 4-epimerase GalE [Clostridia bacterium]